MESVIDTVQAATLEVGDIISHGEVTNALDHLGLIHVWVNDENDDFAILYNPTQMVDLYGMVYSEEV
jgi:hypothetical protein